MWQCKWRNLVAKFATNASGEQVHYQLMMLMQELPTVGQIFKQCMLRHLVAKFTANASGQKLELIQYTSDATFKYISVRNMI